MTDRSARSSVGFDTVPRRPTPVTIALFAIVVVASSLFAAGFKESGLWVIEQLGGFRDPIQAAAGLGVVRAGLLVAASTVLASVLARISARRWPHRSGLDAIAASARGEDRPISLAATLVRTFGTWITFIGLLPIGRESAILETGGAFGSWIARRFRGNGSTMATAGIAAAFATAYHAPIAAILYLEEHLRIRGSRRAAKFTIGGAIGGHMIATVWLAGRPLLPAVHASAGQLAVAGAVVVIPAAVTARLFLEARQRHTVVRADLSWRRWLLRTSVAAATTGAIVALVPLAAGNGMDALRRTPVGMSLGVAFALALSAGKFVGNTAALAAGAPGGALTPTMTIAAGTALLVITGLHAAGVDLIYVWGAVALSSAAAIAVGLRAPLTAVVLVPEMTGHLSLIPATAVVVIGAVAIDRLVDQTLHRVRGRVALVLDEDG